jgi:carboxyl-terminal processing protease
MRPAKPLALVAALFLAAAAPARQLQNPGFEEAAGTGVPAAWSLSGGADSYTFSADPRGQTGSGAVLRSKAAGGQFGSISQTVSALPYRGSRIRFRAWVRVESREGATAGLWLRVDLTQRLRGFFDNMTDRPITDGGWKPYAIEAYVGRDAQTISAGLILNGAGAAWIDEASIEIIDPDPDRTGATLSRPARAYLDKALRSLREGHINSARSDWPALRGEAYAAASGARTPAETYDAIELVIAALGERHTFFDPPLPPAPTTGAAPARNAPFVNIPPSGRSIGHVGLVRLPGLVTRTPEELAFGETYTATLHTLLKSADDAGACGWIVDLRDDVGGNMWPMLNGLAPILGPGPYGAFVTPGGERIRWISQDGRIITEGTQQEGLSWPALRAAAAPVAVLTGPATVSSGEMTTVAFRGRPHTRFFGQPTGGFTTGNSTVPMEDGAYLIVTSSYIEDRSGQGFTGKITPDEVAPIEDAETAALAWLATQGCRASG